MRMIPPPLAASPAERLDGFTPGGSESAWSRGTASAETSGPCVSGQSHRLAHLLFDTAVAGIVAAAILLFAW